MGQRRVRSLAALALAVALTAAACGGGGQAGGDGAQDAGGEEGAGGTVEIAGEAANDHGTVDVVGQEAVDVEADDFFFASTILAGGAGQVLTVRVTNEGNAPHTFTVDAQGVDLVLDPGQSGEARVALPESGAVLFVCRFHAGRGMRGGLSVGGDLSAAETAGAPGAEERPERPGYGG